VHTNSDFTSALTSAQPGDTISLDAGAVFTGNFVFPAKKNNLAHKWIYIQSSALSSLPPPGTRVSPTDAANMPKIVTPNASSALSIAGGGGYIRLVGIEMYSTSTYLANPNHQPHPMNGFTYYLLSGSTVNNITVDRCYIHGSDTQDVNHGVGFWQNSGYIAAIDSDIRDIHGDTNDSQAFLAFSSPGPFKIVNNYLSASTEEVMFGGSGGYSNPYVQSDIEVRRNHMYKPLAWLPLTTGAQPYKWVVKNNFECKSCRRLVFTGNVLENVWLSGQTGANILLTPRTNSSGYNSVVDDVTMQSNILLNANIGFSVIGYDYDCHPQACINPGESKRVVIQNNLILTRDPADQASFIPQGFSMGHGMDSWLIQHNTVQGINGTQSWASIYFNNASSPGLPTNLWILDNALSRQTTGDGGYLGQAAIDTYMPLPGPDGPRYAGNVMFVPSSDRLAAWPLHDYATTIPFTFVDQSNGNYQLVTPNWLDTSDGQISGIDETALLAAQQ
jgi:hypothetical protein